MIPPYEDREQTAVKHRILTRYLSGFVPIVGNWNSNITYIDCLAGPWRSADPNLADTSFASAIEVLRATRKVLSARGKTPRMRCLFIERDFEAFAKLRRYCDGVSDIEVTAHNWDFTNHVDDIVRFAEERSKSFPFVFIDPTGWEIVQPELIAPILRLEPGEVLITLMTSWITRFIGDKSKGFERLLGVDLPRILQLEGEEQEEEVVRCYAKTVRDTGRYKYVCTLPVMKPDQDAFHFFMIYGTRHIRGVEVFKETEKSVIPFMHEARAMAQERRRFEQSGQIPMFGPEARYREKKFTQFRLKNLEVAKCHLRDILQGSEQIPFDDAWAITMQYSGVMNSDLQNWIAEWKNAGQLEITNQQPGQKLPQKNRNQSLKWRNN